MYLPAKPDQPKEYTGDAQPMYHAACKVDYQLTHLVQYEGTNAQPCVFPNFTKQANAPEASRSSHS